MPQKGKYDFDYEFFTPLISSELHTFTSVIAKTLDHWETAIANVIIFAHSLRNLDSTIIHSPPFKRGIYDPRTSLQINKPIGLSRTLGSVNICCLQKTRIQVPKQITELCETTNDVANRSKDTEAEASNQGRVGIISNDFAKAGLIEWIHVNSPMCVIRSSSSCDASRKRVDERFFYFF